VSTGDLTGERLDLALKLLAEIEETRESEWDRAADDIDAMARRIAEGELDPSDLVKAFSYHSMAVGRILLTLGLDTPFEILGRTLAWIAPDVERIFLGDDAEDVFEACRMQFNAERQIGGL